jgi:hypothetical protein
MAAVTSAPEPDSTEAALRESILALLATRAPGASICPSEAARAVHAAGGGPGDLDGWRALMEPTRAAARGLVASGDVVTTQRGIVVDPATASGAMRIRLTDSDR